jgi:hypothetical protein
MFLGGQLRDISSLNDEAQHPSYTGHGIEIP